MYEQSMLFIIIIYTLACNNAYCLFSSAVSKGVRVSYCPGPDNKLTRITLVGICITTIFLFFFLFFYFFIFYKTINTQYMQYMKSTNKLYKSNHEIERSHDIVSLIEGVT